LKQDKDAGFRLPIPTGPEPMIRGKSLSVFLVGTGIVFPSYVTAATKARPSQGSIAGYCPTATASPHQRYAGERNTDGGQYIADAKELLTWLRFIADKRRTPVSESQCLGCAMWSKGTTNATGHRFRQCPSRVQIRAYATSKGFDPVLPLPHHASAVEDQPKRSYGSAFMPGRAGGRYNRHGRY
jgi:hypothetical protein